MTTAEEARQQVAELEEQLGFTLREWPVAHLDQWTAHLRDLAGQLDVDLTDPQQAHAAFTGAYMLFAVMLAGGPMMYGHAVRAAHTMRALADRATAGPAVPPALEPPATPEPTEPEQPPAAVPPRQRRWWPR